MPSQAVPTRKVLTTESKYHNIGRLQIRRVSGDWFRSLTRRCSGARAPNREPFIVFESNRTTKDLVGEVEFKVAVDRLI
jgi:hypothetical protein